MPPKKQAVICGKCDTAIKQKDKNLSCSICNIPFHTRCYKIPDEKHELLSQDDSLFWFCNSCRVVTVNISQGCYLDECQWLALVQVDSGTYAGDTESLE